MEKNSLSYQFGDEYCPIPPYERGLQTVTAEYFFQVSPEKAKHVEGICFDRDGNLYFASISDGKICKLDMQTKSLTDIYQDQDLKPTAVKIHRDGRLFVCFIGMRKSGRIIAMNPDGSNVQIVVAGMDVDDMVFDSKGGFYFTYYVGNVENPCGAIYYVAPDLSTVTPVIKNLAKPNGIALSTDGKILWITETDKGRLLRQPVPGIPGHTTVAYHFAGAVGPDSCSIDADDNVYVALFGQGRVMAFNSRGFPIGQILMPNREKGHNLFTTHPMVHPDKKELYIIASDDYGSEGSWIFRAGSFAKGNGNAFQFR